jgi:hypothetical protein
VASGQRWGMRRGELRDVPQGALPKARPPTKPLTSVERGGNRASSLCLPDLDHRLRTLNPAANAVESRENSRAFGRRSRLFPARGTAKGPRRRADGPQHDGSLSGDSIAHDFRGVILIHGWPGSVVEMLTVVGPLTDRRGSDGVQAPPPPSRNWGSGVRGLELGSPSDRGTDSANPVCSRRER